MNITIVGGGNIGTILLGELASRPELEVKLLTSRPAAWGKEICVVDKNDNLITKGVVNEITDDPRVVRESDVILFTVPSNVLPKMVKKVEPHITPGTYVGVIPGSGGSEFFCETLIKKGCVLFGFQRVHCIARVKEYGHAVYALGKKDEIQIAAIPTKKTSEVCNLIENLLHIRCKALHNYLEVTLTPSNPILHTARLYSMFKYADKSTVFDSNIPFYSGWTDEASETLIACDEELQNMCKRLARMDLTGVRSLKEHYESYTVEDMTKKISNIVAFQGIMSPMFTNKEGTFIDLESRYFIEDFPYGLCIIKGFCEIVQISTPMIDTILRWYEKIKEVEYYVSNKFEGRDVKNTAAPQNFSILSIEDIYNFYLQ